MRTASRLASGLNADWLVVSLERADGEAESSGAMRQLDETFRLAEQLGAETRRIIGNDFVEEILKLARREHATQIVIGTRRHRFPLGLFRRSLPDALAARAAGIAIHLVTDGSAPAVKPAARRRSTLPEGWGRGCHRSRYGCSRDSTWPADRAIRRPAEYLASLSSGCARLGDLRGLCRCDRGRAHFGSRL